MAAKIGGLGKGLEALFAENAVEEQGKTVTLRITEIEPNKAQPRKQFDDGALSDLAASIAQHGILQPLLVRPLTDGSYQLVAGERRWRAARMAGLTEVPVVVREISDREAAELALIENLQRQDLTPLEEAEGYRSLIEQSGMTQEQVAKRLGKSRPVIANALRLLTLPEEVKSLLESGKLSPGHARLLVGQEESSAKALAAEVAAKRLSVRELEKKLKAAKKAADAPKEEKKPAAANIWGSDEDKMLQELMLGFREETGRELQIVKNGKRGGTVTIHYYDEQDLMDIVSRLAGHFH